MIVIRLMGGLGNQLFQYALAYKLKNDGNEVFLEDTLYTINKERKNEIVEYDLKVGIVKGIAKAFFHFLYYFNRVFRRELLVYKEKELFRFEEGLEKHVYLSGYWQNTRYFNDIIDKLRNDFVCKKTFSIQQQELIVQIRNTESVAVHVRRGDYLLKKNQSIYVCQEAEYYLNAMDELEGLKPNCEFFVFSDDIEWCKNIFCDKSNLIIVDEKYENNTIDDFEMMRLCNHFIISNSTYSWWAAILGKKADSVMLAPKKWFVNESSNDKCREAILTDFILL